jgi:flagellar hook capping protein FlgD
VTDPAVTFDGWYIDNVTVSDSRCRSVTAVGDDPHPIPLLALRGSNPFRGALNVSIHAAAGTPAEIDLFDVSGRRIARIWEGTLPGDLDLTWDGRDAQGQQTASGLYFLRARVGKETRVVRAVKLP